MSSGWNSPPTAFVDEAMQRLVNVHSIVFDEVEQSWREGSAITGSKGQPVDQFELRPSIAKERANDVLAECSTKKAYAPSIEDGVGPHGPLTLRSTEGQFHAREATIQGFGAIVDHANAVVP